MVRTPSGGHHKVEVVHLPTGAGRQLAHELVARLIDGAQGDYP